MGKAAGEASKVLVLDSDHGRAADVAARLRFLNFAPAIADDGRSPELDLRDDGLKDEIAVVIGDFDKNGELAQVASSLRAARPDIPFLLLPSDSRSDETLTTGPNWNLDLPLKRSQLERLLGRAQRYRGQERRQRITGNSLPVRMIREMIEQVADFESTVLVTGESGTGKELVARTIHELSARFEGPFVPINCGAIPADLLESELFGHEKGAFTGAVATRTGRFELAEGGTLFLDEIGDMSMSMQVKLLRVLQERTYERVGSNKMRQCNVRIVAATHRDLPAAVKAGEFREDLFYRLNVFPIEMPALCKRKSDLPLLLQELLIQHQQNDRPVLRVSKEALNVLAGYDWPGNIRELSNLVERLAIVKPEGTIGLDDIPAKYKARSSQTASNSVSEALQLSSSSLKEYMQSIEQDYIDQAMQATNGVVAKAARMLNMRRTTLVEKIGKYEIH